MPRPNGMADEISGQFAGRYVAKMLQKPGLDLVFERVKLRAMRDRMRCFAMKTR